MPRYGTFRIANDGRARYFEELSRLIARLETIEEVRGFVFDMFSLSEVVMFMRRIEIARLLAAGAGYDEIGKILGAGRTLIRDVAARLYRSGHGFQAMIERMPAIEQELFEEIELAERRQWDADEQFKQRLWMHHWPELLAREMPKIVKNVAAARKRRKSLKKQEKNRRNSAVIPTERS